jgi:hypothetical protein
VQAIVANGEHTRFFMQERIDAMLRQARHKVSAATQTMSEVRPCVFVCWGLLFVLEAAPTLTCLRVCPMSAAVLRPAARLAQRWTASCCSLRHQMLAQQRWPVLSWGALSGHTAPGIVVLPSTPLDF